MSLQQIRVNVPILKSPFLDSAALRTVLSKYGKRLGSVRKAMGYGGLACPIIFQHGCPNNVPLIFWVQPSKASRIRWRPLFPGRSVSAEVYPLFTEDMAKQAVPEELWMVGHFQLALNVLDRISQYKDSHHLLLTLSLLAKGHSVEKVKNTLVLTVDEFESLLTELREGGLTDEFNVVTRFGRDVIARASKPEKKSVVIAGETNFYPSSFLGFQRGA
jgi:hypothetical protein